MFIVALAMVLASNGPACRGLCDTDVYEKELKQCSAERDRTSGMVDGALGVAAEVATRLAECEKKLATCSPKACQTKKKSPPKKKVVVVKKEESKTQCCALAPHDQTLFQDQKQEQHQTVIVNVQAPPAPAALFMSETTDPYPWLGLGVRGAGGTAFCAPAGIGLLGLRLNLLKLHLGLDVYTEFYHGTGAQVLLYPVQTKVVMWHFNGGLIGFNQRPFVTPDLPRQLDLTLGTGLEFRVLPFLWVTADLQARMANPVAIAQSGQQFSTVLGKSLLQTQGMLGIMIRTW